MRVEPVLLLPVLWFQCVLTWEADYELRELKCTAPGADAKFPRCILREDGDFLPFRCFPSRKGGRRNGGRIRWYCSLRCRGAARALDIQKQPQFAHTCAQFYSYDTERRSEDWFIWMDDFCFRHNNVTLSVWCEYPWYKNRQ